MWETIIVHDFTQEEKRPQFNNQVKGKDGNKMIIIRAEGTNCKPQIYSTEDQVIK